MMNRSASASLGLASAVFINGVVFCLATTLWWFLVKMGWVSMPAALGANPIENLTWKNIVPGLCGVVIVVATPMALMHLGAALTFSLVIATQLILGLVLDATLGGKVVGWPQIVGAVVMLLGCMLILNADKLQR